MKRIFIFIVAIIVSAHIFGQPSADSLKTQKDYYLQKAKKKRTTSFILFGTGAGLVIAGVVDAASTGEYTGLIPILAGTIVMLSSVPFFNAAANYKRKANSITFTRQI